MPAARTVAAILVLALLAGCLGGTAPGTSPTEKPASATSSPRASPTEYTPLPDRTTAFPDGPKSPPARPDELTNESLRAFLTTYERRWVYNTMYPGPGRNYEAHISNCGVRSLERREVGYVAVVGCTAYAEYDARPSVGNETGTPAAVHADWFTQHFTYLVDEDSLIRRRPTEAEKERAGVSV
jgi:hypothetical protein